MTPQHYCRDKAAPRGSSLYYALYFAARDRQPALYAVHAFQREVAEIVREVSDPKVGHMKLKWWQEELERAFAGEGRHPVSLALQQDALPRFSLPREYFEEIITAVEMDLDYGLYPTFKELSLYGHRLGGSLTHLAAQICGYQDDQSAVRYAHDLGMGLQLMTVLRNVRRDVQAGRLYIPEDELAQAGVTRADLLRPQSSEKVRALFATQAERIHKFLDQAIERLSPQDRYAQRSGIILARLYGDLLREMEQEGFPLLEKRFHLTPIRKFWTAWQTARQQQRYKGARA